MSDKFLTFFTIVCVLFLFNKVECKKNENSGVSLECWPYYGKLNYTDFKIDMYFSFGRKVHQLLAPRHILTENVGFDPKRKTVVIVHGFLGSANGNFMVDLRNELLLTQDANIIAVDWHEGCDVILKYPLSVLNTRTVARSITKVFSDTLDYWLTKDVEPKDWAPVHFIGHSLGAHIVGQAARYLRAKKNITIDRVTALDPAEPCFENATFPLRLRKTDAKFVDVTHTDAAPEKNLGFSIYEPMGHADFYVNGGTYQPGCPQPLHLDQYTTRRKRELNFFQLLVHTFLFDGNCAHNRAFKLFNESVRQNRLNQCKFWAHPWRPSTRRPENSLCNDETCQQFGINAKPVANDRSVSYYVATTDVIPFCNVR